MAVVLSPEVQLRDAAVSAIASVVPSGSVRAVYDTSDDRGLSGVFVGASCDGDHDGCGTSHEVIDCTVTATCYTHLDDDSSGSSLDALVADVVSSLCSFSPSLTGWCLLHAFAPTTGDTGAYGGVFRSAQVTMTAVLQRVEVTANE